MVLEPRSPRSQFISPEPSRKTGMLENSVSQEPLRENKSRVSPDSFGRPWTTVKHLELGSLKTTSPWPLKARPGCDSVSKSQFVTRLYSSWNCQILERHDSSGFVTEEWHLHNPQVSTVRGTDPASNAVPLSPAPGTGTWATGYCSHSICSSFGLAILLCHFCHHGGSGLRSSHSSACYHPEFREEEGEGQLWA